MGYQRLKTLPVPFNVNFLVARRKFPPFFSPIALFFLLEKAVGRRENVVQSQTVSEIKGTLPSHEQRARASAQTGSQQELFCC